MPEGEGATSDRKASPTIGNPTLTVELTSEGNVCVGVFRYGRIDKGGFVTRSQTVDGVWLAQTARRSAASKGPAYRGESRAVALMTAIETLDREERGRSRNETTE